jgi:hypothetical protein
MRFAAIPADFAASSADGEEFNEGSWEQFGAPVAAASNETQVAMTPAEARQLLGRFTSEAVKGNITPDAFTTGLFTAGEYANSPDLIRRTIRNSLKSPVGRAVVANPGIARALGGQHVGKLKGVGVNPDTARKYVGLGADLLQQAKKDGLLRSDVTHGEIREKLQKPMYAAMQEFAETNRANPVFNELTRRGLPDIRGYNSDGTPRKPLEVLLQDFIR